MLTLRHVDLLPYRLPLTAPIRLKAHLLAERTGWVLKLTDASGTVGYGDVAPLPGFSTETPAEAHAQLCALQTDLPGQTVAAAGFRAGYRTDLCASVRFGLELALGQLFASQAGTSLATWLNPAARARPLLNGLLAGDPAGFVDQARRYRHAGFRAVKMKVGRQAVDRDVADVQAVREALGPAVALRLDANQAWTFAQALAFAEGIDAGAVAYIEEPLQVPAQLPALAQAWPLPIALDESALALTPEALAEHSYAAAVVYKPTLAGGLVRGLHLAAEAQALGMEVVVSAAYESGVGLLGLAALAAAVNTKNVPAGLDTYRWLQEDVWHPRLDFSYGYLDLPSATATPRTWHPDLQHRHA